MKIEITDAPAAADEALVVAGTHDYNAAFVGKDVRRLCVFARDEEGAIMGGLTGKTYWNYLEIAFLWVNERHRRLGHGSELVKAAELEARQRGCQYALLDTYSFQALGFYQKLGYAEFGRLAGFSGKHVRYYLHKALTVAGIVPVPEAKQTPPT
jgi:ribosomal protein S18 acetylase RimI-like enzyme